MSVRARTPRKNRLLALGVSTSVVAALVVARAWAALPIRAATYTWDKNSVLRGTFSFRDAIDDPAIKKKLTNGLGVHLVMRGYVYPNGGANPVALTAHSCKVAYDLWEEVYRVVVNSGKTQIAPNMNGVYRRCTDMADLTIADRTTLAGKGSGYFLGVKVEVNPTSPAMLQQIQQWVTRPSGASGTINPGDALFASFVGAFMTKVPTADKVVEFQTASFPP